MKNLLCLMIFTMVFIVGCGGGSGSSNASNPTSSDDSNNNLVVGSFVDSKVTAFSYSNGSVGMLIFKNKIKSLADYIISSSYAISSTYSCEYGFDVSFSMTANGVNVNKTLTCNSPEDIDLGLRKALIPAIAAATYIKGAAADGYTGGSITLGTGIGVVNIGRTHVYATINGYECYATYTFQTDGRLKVNKLRALTALYHDATYALNCPDLPLHYGSYRFKDGNIEVDLSETDNFDSSSPDYERWNVQ